MDRNPARYVASAQPASTEVTRLRTGLGLTSQLSAPSQRRGVQCTATILRRADNFCDRFGMSALDLGAAALAITNFNVEQIPPILQRR